MSDQTYINAGLTPPSQADKEVIQSVISATPDLYGSSAIGSFGYNPNPYLANQLGQMGTVNPMAALGQNNYTMSPANFTRTAQTPQTVRSQGLLAPMAVAPYAALNAKGDGQ